MEHLQWLTHTHILTQSYPHKAMTKGTEVSPRRFGAALPVDNSAL